jgi:hypothetical protein
MNDHPCQATFPGDIRCERAGIHHDYHEAMLANRARLRWDGMMPATITVDDCHDKALFEYLLDATGEQLARSAIMLRLAAYVESMAMLEASRNALRTVQDNLLAVLIALAERPDIGETVLEMVAKAIRVPPARSLASDTDELAPEQEAKP